MSKMKIKDGTPVGNEHMCRNCSHGQFTTGYRETDVLVICTNASPARLVPFPVRECTDYWDRNRPGYDEMTKLALNFNESRRKPVRGFNHVGFEPSAAAATGVASDGDDEDEESEAARAR
jgi:hypothetical protein